MFKKYNSIKEMVLDRQWNRGDNYIGDDLNDYVTIIPKTRDSQSLESYNFDAVSAELKKASKHVKIANFGHWACGWFKSVMVKKTDLVGLKKAFEILNQLSDYPVFDELEYSDYVREELSELIKDNTSLCMSIVCSNLGIDELRMSHGLYKDLAYFIALNFEVQENNYGIDDCFFDIDATDQTLKLMSDNGLEFNLKKTKKMLENFVKTKKGA